MKVLLLFLLVSSAHASPLFDTFLCKKELEKLASQWHATGNWEQQYLEGLDNTFYSSTTDKIGEWVVTKQILDGSAMSKISQSGRIEVSFKGKKCEKDEKAYPHQMPSPNLLNDKDIESFVTKNKEGVIYIWSPRMILSQNGIEEIKKAGTNLKLPVLVLLDKEITGKELKKLRKKLGPVDTARIDSFEFRMRNVGQHFPAILVFKDSKILPGIKYGHEKSDRYQSDLANMLGRGK
jgi:hypothetical protein